MTDDALQQQAGGTAADAGPERAPTGEPAPAAGGADPEAMAAELARCHDRLLRTAAEFDNYRKRTERERHE
jgi:molecular chaperone GrpE